MNRITLALVAAMALLLIVNHTNAAVDTSVESTTWVANDPRDAGMSSGVSDSDLLEGLSPSFQAGAFFGVFPESRLTDGAAGTQNSGDLNGIALVLDSGGDATFTYDALGGVNIAEIRIFTSDETLRAEFDIDVLYSIDNGANFDPIVTGLLDPSGAGGRLIRIFDDSNDSSVAIASGVTNLRFVSRRIGAGTLTNIGTAFFEIDAIATTATVPVPAALPAGLAAMGLLAARRRR